MSDLMVHKTDILVVGGGPAAGVLSILLSELGFKVSLVDARNPKDEIKPDSRAFAIVRGGWHVLEAAGVAKNLIKTACPLQGMEAHDANGVLPAAHSIFGVDDLSKTEDDEPLGYMVEVDQLNLAIQKRVKSRKDIQLFAPALAEELTIKPGNAVIKLQSGEEIEADLVVGADGVGSSIRHLAGIRNVGWDYDQAVVAVTVELLDGHNYHARQWFQDEGPFALLPLNDNRGNIAWFRQKDAGLATAQLSREELEAEINHRFAHLTGPMKVLRDPLAYPLKLNLANDLISERVALVGDAVRKINPLAGQGFNLGLKDIAALVEVLCESRMAGLSLADGAQLEKYQQWRRFDSVSTALAMDGMNRVFSNNNKLLTPFKRLALTIGDRVAPLRQALARQASADQKGLPALVRGEPLSAL